MKIELTVSMTDGISHEVTAGVPEIVAWEQKFKGKMSDWANGIALTDMAFMSWYFLNRTKVTGMPYDQWINNVDSIEAVDADPKVIEAEA
jgi:hypothetical protein